MTETAYFETILLTHSIPTRPVTKAVPSRYECAALPLLLLIHTNLKSYFNRFILPSRVTIPFDNYHLREGVSLSWPIFTSGMKVKKKVSFFYRFFSDSNFIASSAPLRVSVTR